MIASAWYRDDFFGVSREVHKPEDLEGKNLLILWGGEDICPSIYGQKSVHAHCRDEPSRRDLEECELVLAARDMGLPILGICRGAQLLCALDGGTLWQDVDGHAIGGDHHIYTKHDHFKTTNSYHHQMMCPSKDTEILAFSIGLSTKKYADSEVPCTASEHEPEVVYFPKLNAIGVQGHPEWLKKEHFLNRYTRRIVKQYLNFNLE